jgi:lysophospholipase L1-like esterase
MQGGLRMKINVADLGKGEIPVYKPVPPPEPKPGGIIMFGDSTTALRPGNVERVYSVRVQEALQSTGSTMAVYNAGIGGNTTRDARKRFQNHVLRHKPQVVVMQFGINDAAVDVWKNPPVTEPRVPLSEYVENLRSMIGEARAQGAKVILMTTNPIRWAPRMREMYGKPPYHAEAEDGFDALHLAGYNDALRKLAEELQMPLVDIRAAYPAYAARNKTTVDGLLLDGVHPNDLGHRLVAQLLVPAIVTSLQ